MEVFNRLGQCHGSSGNGCLNALSSACLFSPFSETGLNCRLETAIDCLVGRSSVNLPHSPSFTFSSLGVSGLIEFGKHKSNNYFHDVGTCAPGHLCTWAPICINLDVQTACINPDSLGPAAGRCQCSSLIHKQSKAKQSGMRINTGQHQRV